MTWTGMAFDSSGTKSPVLRLQLSEPSHVVPDSSFCRTISLPFAWIACCCCCCTHKRKAFESVRTER